MKIWLKKPFPFVHSNKQSLFLSLGVGIFVTLFLFIFKPFGIDQMPTPLLYLSGYGLISFWVSYFFMQLLPIILPKWHNSTNWNVGKNIMLMIEILFVISVFNWMYGVFLFNTIGPDYEELQDMPIGFLQNIGMTFSVGIFPILMINYVLEKQLFAKNVRLAKEVESTMSHVKTSLQEGSSIDIPLDNGITVNVSSQKLLCVKAEGGNYVTIYWKENDVTQSQLWRITLKKLLGKIDADNDILQCHKSYLINRSFVTEVTGNARTLVLKVEGLDFDIPVSRNFPRELVEHYHLQQA